MRTSTVRVVSAAALFAGGLFALLVALSGVVRLLGAPDFPGLMAVVLELSVAVGLAFGGLLALRRGGPATMRAVVACAVAAGLAVAISLAWSLVAPSPVATPEVTAGQVVGDRVAADPERQAAVQAMGAVMDAGPSFEDVTAAFYAIRPQSIQSDVFARCVEGRQVTWSGYVVDPAGHAVIVDAAHWSGQAWDSTAPEAAYSFSTRGCDLSGYAAGDRVTLTGTVGARGCDIDGAYLHWRLENVSVVE